MQVMVLIIVLGVLVLTLAILAIGYSSLHARKEEIRALGA